MKDIILMVKILTVLSGKTSEIISKSQWPYNAHKIFNKSKIGINTSFGEYE